MDTEQTITGQKYFEQSYTDSGKTYSGFALKTTAPYDEAPAAAECPGIWVTDNEGNRIGKFEYLLGNDGSRYVQLCVAPPGTAYDVDNKQVYIRFGYTADGETYLKLGDLTVGSSTTPIYLNNGVPTAAASSGLSGTVGSSTRAIYLNNGNLAQCNARLDDHQIGGYISEGSYKDVIVTYDDTGTNRVGTIRSYKNSGSNSILIGAHNESNGAPQGLTVTNTDGTITADLNNVIIPAAPGTIAMFAGSSTPTGWLLCNGATANRTTYANLYSAIGTTYGSGNGSTTFTLPDFRNRFPEGVNTYSLGTSVSAGVPNATGTSAHNTWANGGGDGSNGCMSYSSSSGLGSIGDGTDNARYQISVDLSKSNSIFGSASTVQPQALAVYYIIKT